MSSTQDFVEKSPSERATEPTPQSRNSATSAGEHFDADQAVAADIQRQLSERIGDDRFDMWFDGEQNFQVCHTPAPQVSISADSPFTSQRIQSSLGRDIRLIVDRVCGPQFSVVYTVLESKSVEPNVSARSGVGTDPLPFDSSHRVPTDDSSDSDRLSGSLTATIPMLSLIHI